MKNWFNGSHITIVLDSYLVSKENIIFDKVVIWWLFGNVPRMLGENVLLTRFEYQRFNGTTKGDTIHIVYILVIIRIHLHIPYWRNHMKLYIFGNVRQSKHNCCEVGGFNCTGYTAGNTETFDISVIQHWLQIFLCSVYTAFLSSFADDTRVGQGITSTSDIECLQRDLQAVYKWSVDNNMQCYDGAVGVTNLGIMLLWP